MFLAANPDKGRTAEEKEAEKLKYTPGEEVCPKVEEKEKSLRERRREDEDRRLMNEVRDLSLREVGVETPEARRERRRLEHGSRAPSSRDASRDSRNTDERERRRRREEEGGRRSNTLQPNSESSDERRRRRSNDRRRRHEETSRTAARQIEHQSSLRSLISSSDVDSHEMEEEILRQIREEGLLDGIDLENIDVNQEDQISERIAEAFRRRQSERARQEPARRSDASARRRDAPTSAPPTSDSRANSDTEGVRTSRRARTHSRSPSAISNSEQPSRPPQSISAAQSAHLEVQSSDEGRHRRRRTTSGVRISTAPISVADPAARPAARSQTDLSNRPQSAHSSARPVIAETSRSSTDPAIQQATALPVSDQRPRQQTTPNTSPRLRSTARFEDISSAATVAERRLHVAPAELSVPPATTSTASQPSADQALMPAPLSPRNHSGHSSLSDRANALSSGSRPNSSSSTGSTVGTRKPTQLYPEPSLTCARCAKSHIEYDLHYNCAICSNGSYNICLSCYRDGMGCLHWFGFGEDAWTKWDHQMRLTGHHIERPHMLTPSRYIPPRASPGGADGRRTLTAEDPEKRLQSGTFCMNCFAWTNECYWRCLVCNDGDWGFCNLCVNQGRSCTHPLLPLTYQPPVTDSHPISPTHDHQTPPSASILTGPGVMDIGPFKPLTFTTRCDVCRYPIQPSQPRYHCFSCTSKVPNTLPGDYDICTSCYLKQVSSRRITAENGNNGWRRCVKGHRMIVVGFEDSRGGQRRIIIQDLVGGRGLKQEPLPNNAELEKWSWGNGIHIRGDDTNFKIATIDVMKSTPPPAPGGSVNSNGSASFPPDGGVGMTALAEWGWFPKEGADDELLFPRGAEIRECKDVNGDWWHGTYMGTQGLFPSPYVKILERSG